MTNENNFSKNKGADLFLSEFEELDVANPAEIKENVNTIFDSSDVSSMEDELAFIDAIDLEKDIEPSEDELSKTMEIDLFNDSSFEEAITALKHSEKGLEVEPPVSNAPAEVLERKIEQPLMTMEAAFVNCAILGFITLFSGFGWLFWILNKIAG